MITVIANDMEGDSTPAASGLVSLVPKSGISSVVGRVDFFCYGKWMKMAHLRRILGYFLDIIQWDIIDYGISYHYWIFLGKMAWENGHSPTRCPQLGSHRSSVTSRCGFRSWKSSFIGVNFPAMFDWRKCGCQVFLITETQRSFEIWNFLENMWKRAFPFLESRSGQSNWQISGS